MQDKLTVPMDTSSLMAPYSQIGRAGQAADESF